MVGTALVGAAAMTGAARAARETDFIWRLAGGRVTVEGSALLPRSRRATAFADCLSAAYGAGAAGAAAGTASDDAAFSLAAISLRRLGMFGSALGRAGGVTMGAGGAA